jgi:hypothetical protein
MFQKLDLLPFSGEGRHLLCWFPKKELTSDGPVIEVSSFYGTQQSMSPSTCGRKQIHFPKLVFSSSLEYRTMGKVRKPSNSGITLLFG